MAKISIRHLVGNGKFSRQGFIRGVAAVSIFTAGFLSTGCSKSQPPSAQAPPVAETDQVSVAAPPVRPTNSTPIVVAAKPEGGADLKQLNQAYIGWIVSNKRRVKSFEEYVALSGIQVPPPPAGKKYVIDRYGYINFADK